VIHCVYMIACVFVPVEYNDVTLTAY